MNAPKAAAPAAISDGNRVAKVIARAGICSRREAEVLIEQGRVTVNGTTLTKPGVKVTADDLVRVDGEKLPALDPPRLWRYNKPVGLVTSHKDERGRETVFDALPDHLPRVISIGRLDLNSEGLLLLTNDGGLARSMEHPSRGWTRRYRARVHGEIKDGMFEPLAKGVTIDGINYGPVQVKLDRKPGTNAWLTVSLNEGKNREVRRGMEHVGLKVSRLMRTAYGPFQLGSLKPGELVEMPHKVLKEQLGGDLPDIKKSTGRNSGGNKKS
ncbi:MAG: rRNA pseudouridine synthase [Rhodospirillaceae bacterium]|nr:rRNA pseudouridine synthase [Rhodospirillaceae bacterium]